MAGIDEVARIAGVSTATVSRALSGRGQVSAPTRERVAAAAASIGYVVSSAASSLASGRTRNVGVIVPFLERWYFSTVLSGISTQLARHGYDATLYNITADTEVRRATFETHLRRRRIDAVIAVSTQLDEAETDVLEALDMPVVVIGGLSPRLPSLAVDDEAVARTATEHLLGLGHRLLAHIGARPEFDLDFRVPSHRRDAFVQRTREAGVSVPAEWLEAADFTIAGGHDAALRLLTGGEQRPTGIFAASDEMAIGAILAARELGLRVPEDLSVVGVDGHDLGEFFEVTTVDQFPLRQGERAAQRVLDMLAQQEDSGHITPASREELPAQLIVRASTAGVAQG